MTEIRLPCKDCISLPICYAEYKKMEPNFMYYLIKRCDLIKEYLYFPTNSFSIDVYDFFKELKNKKD